MSAISELTGVLPSLSGAHLLAVVILGAFALAAFAIHAVCQVAKGRRK